MLSLDRKLTQLWPSFDFLTSDQHIVHHCHNSPASATLYIMSPRMFLAKVAWALGSPRPGHTQRLRITRTHPGWQASIRAEVWQSLFLVTESVCECLPGSELRQWVTSVRALAPLYSRGWRHGGVTELSDIKMIIEVWTKHKTHQTKDG